MTFTEEHKERQIGDYRFRIGLLHFAASRAVFVRLSKALGPALQEVTEGVPTIAHLLAGKVTADAMGRALATLVDHVSEEDLRFLSDKLSRVSYVERDGDWALLTDKVQDSLFRGKLSVWFAWILQALEVNFSDFFEGWADRGGPAPTEKEDGAAS